MDGNVPDPKGYDVRGRIRAPSDQQTRRQRGPARRRPTMHDHGDEIDDGEPEAKQKMPRCQEDPLFGHRPCHPRHPDRRRSALLAGRSPVRQHRRRLYPGLHHPDLASGRRPRHRSSRVDDFQTVKEGQVLVQLDPRDYPGQARPGPRPARANRRPTRSGRRRPRPAGCRRRPGPGQCPRRPSRSRPGPIRPRPLSLGRRPPSRQPPAGRHRQFLEQIGPSQGRRPTPSRHRGPGQCRPPKGPRSKPPRPASRPPTSPSPTPNYSSPTPPSPPPATARPPSAPSTSATTSSPANPSSPSSARTAGSSPTTRKPSSPACASASTSP